MTSLKEIEGLKYTEYINLKNGLKILQFWDDILSKLPENRQKKIKESSKDFDPIIHLKKICKDKSEIIYTTYKFSKSLKTYGRLFAQNSSLQGIPREIRNALAYGIYYDIDMKNAHPTILSQYCKKNGIRCDILDEYVRNRDELLIKISNETSLPKESVKQQFLSILNGGNTTIKNNEFINEYIDEIKLIHKQICSLNPEEFKKMKLRKEYNPMGSMLNVILCKLEHSILMNSVLFFKDKGFNVDVLVFDGFMVRKEEDKILTDELLNELNIYIKKMTDYDVKFVEKSIENLIDLSVYPEPVLDEIQKISYHKDKEEFEKNHLKIRHPLMYLSILKDGTIDYQTEEKIKGSYKHLKTTIVNENTNKIEKVPFINVWLNDEHIRVYDKMVFVPPPSYYHNEDYNTWRPFSIEEVKLPENFDVNDNVYVKKYQEFISNLFDNNEDYVNYYNAWCANIIQEPSKRSAICLVLYSLFEGVGKNMSTKTLELCIGENYTFNISDVSNQLFGKHSCAELNKLLIVLNEVKGKDTYSNTDLFKTRITDDKREIEMKGKDTFQITNYSRYILNTNNLNAVNAGDKDRRFCVLPCVNKMMNDKLYFDDYEKNINQNPEAIRCIYEFLKTFDIEKFVPNKLFASARPKSELYKDLQECNREKEWDFLEKIVCGNIDSENITITTDDLWMSFKSFCLSNNYDLSKMTSKRFHYLFTQNIMVMLNSIPTTLNAIEKDRNKTSRYYKFNIEKLKQHFNMT